MESERLNHLLGLIQSRQWDAAWVEFVCLKEEGPQTPQLLLMGSRSAYGKRDLFGARHLVDQALSLWNPKDPTLPPKLLGLIRFHLGKVTRELGDISVALEQFDLFLAELPAKYPELSMAEGDAHVWRAVTLRQKKEMESAVAAYQQAISCYKRDELPALLCLAYQNFAWLLCYMDRRGEAREALELASPLVKTSEDQIHQTLGEAFLAAIDGKHGLAADLCQAIFHRAERGEPVTSSERSQTAWVAAKVALAQRNLDSATALADVALSYAADARDSRLMNDASALRREVQMARQAGA